MIVAGDDVVRFAGCAIGVSFCPPWTAMGIERDGRIIAGVVFNCFEGSDVHVSAAGQGWTRGFLQEVGHYVYGTLGCERMTIVTASDAVATLALRLGGVCEGRLRSHFGPGVDGIVIGVLRSEYRFATPLAHTRG